MKKIFFVKLALWILFFFILAIAPFVAIKNRYITVDLFKKGSFDIKDVIKYFPFSEASSLREWEEKMLKGRVVYNIEKGDDLSYVRAKSQKTASALYYKVELDISKHPVIRWKWRVDKFPTRKFPESIANKKEEDFAARIYVMMPAVFFTETKVIEYIWSETLEKGTSGQSGYSKNIKILVLEKGKANDWRFEKRDIYEDFVKLFGEKPRLKVGAIAFMTDADSTETSADAVYDEIKIGYE